MSTGPQTPGVEAYYDTLQKLFHLQSQVLSGVLPHYGERGANDEERARDFLSKVLPRKFSVGTGFIVCSAPDLPPSSQTDIVIYDEIHNSPLHRELSAYVYPAEMVYGTVEVKATLRSGDLKKILEDVQRVRAMAKHRWYVRYLSRPRDPARPTELVVVPDEFTISAPPSRSFVFAFSQEGWSSIEGLADSLTRATREVPAHLHGLVVLSDNWYLAQEAYAGRDPRYYTSTKNALLQFVNGLVHSLASLPMFQCSIDKYLGARGA
ncbi:MAG TPA: DUF6602 domain-containing protein [Methylomirabilota bacterium]|jgi:hypothetical protein|nr:DUF6602 domain-containing protein [Methylomirabilota bacterium]